MSPGADTTPRWVDTDTDLAAVLDELAEAPTVALDTEFHRERTYFPKLALVQIAYEPDELVLIDPLEVDLAPLAGILESDTTIVIHAASQDLEVLRLATGTVPRNLFDTQIAAGFVGYSNPSLATLHAGLLDVQLSKSDRLTDWLVRPLPGRVLDYAADDVRYLLQIHDRLVRDLSAEDRLEWARSEFDLERARGAEAKDPDEAWRRVKGAGRLRGRAAAVARSVAAWRERQAAALDLPVRHVLGDLALVSIAQRPPRDHAALREVRGIDGRSLSGGRSDGLLAAVGAGRAADAPPSDPRAAQPPDPRRVCVGGGPGRPAPGGGPPRRPGGRGRGRPRRRGTPFRTACRQTPRPAPGTRGRAVVELVDPVRARAADRHAAPGHPKGHRALRGGRRPGTAGRGVAAGPGGPSHAGPARRGRGAGLRSDPRHRARTPKLHLSVELHLSPPVGASAFG